MTLNTSPARFLSLSPTASRPLAALTLAAAMFMSGCASLNGPGTPDSADTAQTTHTQAMPLAGEMSPLESGQLNRQGVTQLAAPSDLWERLRRGFAMPDLDSDLVHDREAWYAQQPDYLLRMTERSRMYIFHIVEELERRNMPTELALLPFVESAFNPQAVSSAKAAGMWQFMPATGKYFDLTQNVFRDDRRDVLQSTRAALDYLQKLRDMFGDWHLALAAYNWGEGNVAKALQRARDAGQPADYANLRMPNETRMYVPKLQALENIVANPERFGATLPDIGNHPFFDTVRLSQDMDVATAAELAEIRVDEFKALNPSIHRPVIFAAGTPQILLPWDNAEVFKRNLQARQSRRLASWTAWVAPSNMTVSEAAKANNMSEEEFRALNKVPPRMLVKAGSTLLVPRTEGAAPKVPSQLVDQAHVAFAPEVVLRRVSVRVRKGDTLSRIAARYDLPVATVAGWNKMRTNTQLKRGQTVVLHLPQRSNVSRALAAESRRDSQPTRKTSKTAKADTQKTSGSKTASSKTVSNKTAKTKTSSAKTKTASTKTAKTASVKPTSAKPASKTASKRAKTAKTASKTKK